MSAPLNGIIRWEAMKTFQSFLTGRFDLAFQLASGLHHEQRRKGTEIPYISHLMSVAALVLEAGGDEDQAIAALLHDAMEDQGGPPTLETIRRLFGDRVAGIVKECSDSESEHPENKLPWHQRKQAYLAKLTAASPDALLVSVADKLHNARTILAGRALALTSAWIMSAIPIRFDYDRLSASFCVSLPCASVSVSRNQPIENSAAVAHEAQGFLPVPLKGVP